MFGGSARYCLSGSKQFVADGKKKIDSAIGKIDGLSKLQDCFRGNADADVIVHCLMYYEPKDATSADLVPASDLINAKLFTRVQAQLKNQQQMLMQWLDGCDKASTLFGWLFENSVHERLIKGGQFLMRQLADSSWSPINIIPTMRQNP